MQIALARDAAVRAALRFPTALVLAAVATVWTLHSGFPDMSEKIAWLSAGLVWSLAVRTLLEDGPAPAWARHLLPPVIAALAIWSSWELGHRAFLLSLAGVMALMASRWRPAGADGWDFAFGTAKAFAVSGLAVLLLCGGLSALSAGCDALFSTHTTRILDEVWTIGGLALWPWAAAACLPPASLPARQTLPRWVEFITAYILCPLALAYGLLLNAYCAMIAVQGAFPRGVVGGLVFGYALASNATWALGWPLRQGGPLPIRWLHRSFIPLLVAPAIAMLIAVAQRIESYGVTEDRYYLALCGVALLVMAAAALVRRRMPQPALTVGVGALLLTLANVGPWSAREVSIDSQIDRLQQALSAAGRIQDGRLTPPTTPPSESLAKVIDGTVHYLTQRRAEQRLETALGFELPKFDDRSPYDRGVKIIAAIGGADTQRIARASSEWFTLSWADEGAMAVDGFDRMHLLRLSGAPEPEKRRKTVAGLGTLWLADDANRLMLAREGGAETSFDLAPALAAQMAARPGNPPPVKIADLELPAGKARLMLYGANGHRDAKGEVKLDAAQLFVLLAKGPASR